MERPTTLECNEVELALAVEGNGHHIGDALAPGQLVGVMLIGADEDNGLSLGQHLLVEKVAQITARCRCQRDADDLLELVDRAGSSCSAGDDTPLRTGIDRLLDALLGLMQQLRHAATRDVILGVRVGVDTLQALQV